MLSYAEVLSLRQRYVFLLYIVFASQCNLKNKTE